MKKFQAVIFDRDGVLTDFDIQAAMSFFRPLLADVDLQDLATQWETWGRTRGFPQSVNDEKLFWQGFWDRLAAQLDLSDRTQESLQRFDYTHLVRPFPDARPALQTARDYGLYTGVLSNFTLATINESLTAAGLIDLIDVAVAAFVTGASKPAPEAYLHITRRLQVSPEACLFFDDEQPCVDGARAIGMQAYLVDRKRTEHDLSQGIVADLSALQLILSRIT